MNRKMSLVLIALMFFTAIQLSFDNHVGYAAGSTMSGEGTEADPYIIMTADDLNSVRDDLNAHYKLGNDIDLSNYEWVPIGQINQYYAFQGVFDGNGHKILNLSISSPDKNNIGLFGYLYGSTIRNVILENVDISGKEAVGGLVGTNLTGKIYNSSATGKVVGYKHIGGLVGKQDEGALVEQSYAHVSVSGNEQTGSSEIGGLVGRNDRSTISNSYASGQVIGLSYVGGLTGYSSNANGSWGQTRIENSYASGEVTGNYPVGGLVGLDYESTIVSSFYDRETTGQSDSYKGLGIPTAEMQTRYTFSRVGWDFINIWGMTAGNYPTLGPLPLQQVQVIYDANGATSGMPPFDSTVYLEGDPVAVLPNFYNLEKHGSLFGGWNTQADGNGTNYSVGDTVELGTSNLTLYAKWIDGIVGLGSEHDPYILRTAEHLESVRYNLNAHYKLGNDIDLSDNNNWKPIGSGFLSIFEGHFDGSGYVITGLTIDRPDMENVGLFGYVGPNGKIENVRLENVDIVGRSSVGGLVGTNNGSISYSSVSGSVRGSGHLFGSGNVGGLVGNNQATISKSHSHAAVMGGSGSFVIGGLAGHSSPLSVIDNSYATGGVSGDLTVGGLVGYVFMGQITNSYATGHVTGNNTVGGLVGDIYNGIIHGSFYDQETSGQSDNTGKGEPKSTLEMKTKSTFTDAGWDFNSIWQMSDGQYPAHLAVLTDAEAVEQAKSALEVSFETGDSLTSVTQDVTLPTTGVGDTTISWASSDPGVIGAGGTVTRPSASEGDQVITLTATITKGDATETKNFTVTVKAMQVTDAEAVEQAKTALEVSFETGDSLTSVTQDLTLPTTGASDTMISWGSSDPSVIGEDGTVTRPSASEGDQVITLTATITKGDATETKIFTVTVKAMTETDAEAVEQAKTALEVSFETGDSLTSVTQDLTLPTTGSSDTTISWSSSDPSVIGENGTVTRPSAAEGDQVITLTATITKGDATETKTFTVTVKAMAETDAEAVEQAKAALDISFETGDSLTSVTQDLTLPTTGVGDTMISWSSSDPSVIGEDGTVTRPSASEGDQVITLTATITKGDATETKIFTVTVKAMAETDTEAVEQAKSALEVSFETGDSLTSVTQDLTLPTTGASDTTISWSSTNPSVVGTDGAVTRPSASEGDQVITLTATITKGDATETKIFTVTVKAKSAPPYYGGGDSIQASAPRTEVIVVDVEGENGKNLTRTPIIRTTEPDGTVKDTVRMSEEIAKEAVEKAKESGVSTARIIIPESSDNVSEVIVEIPRPSLQQLNAGSMTLEIVTNNVVISIPSSSLTDLHEDLYFRIVPVKEEEKPQLEESVKSEQLVREAAKDKAIEVLGQPMEIETNMQSREVFIVLPLKDNLPIDPNERQHVLNNLSVFIEHSDGTKELIRGAIVELADGSKGIAFMVTKFSTFTIIYMEGLSEHDQLHDQHSPYINGFSDGTFKPEKWITRAEMAAILARTVTVNVGETVDYFDLQNTHWAYEDIQKVSQNGIMTGYPTGEFKPDQVVTRAEIAAIAFKLKNLQPVYETYFSDTENHWAENMISAVGKEGIMNGYLNGMFNPDQPLNRAEAVVFMNRLLNRGPLKGITKQSWTDVSSNHWAYEEIQEASVSHRFEIKEGFEFFVEIMK